MSGESIGKEFGQLFNEIHNLQCDACDYRKAAQTLAILEDAYEQLCGVNKHKCDDVLAKINKRIVELRGSKWMPK